MHSGRNNAGHKLTGSEKEALRKRAVQQIEGGESPELAADIYGINRRTVCRWLERYHYGGVEALGTQPKPGRPTKFTADGVRWLSRTIRASSNSRLRCRRGGSCVTGCAANAACACPMARSAGRCASSD